MVSALHHMLRAVVKHVAIERRDNDGSGPLKAVLQIGRARADRIQGPGIDLRLLAGAFVEASNVTAVASGKDDLGILGIRSDVSALTSTDLIPIGAVNALVVSTAGDGDGAVVLLGAVYVIGPAVVRDDMIELRRR